MKSSGYGDVRGKPAWGKMKTQEALKYRRQWRKNAQL